MKMRKILSFVLVLSLVLGSFSMAFAATPSDVVGTPNAEAVEVLMGLGIVNGYPDGTFKPDNIVTRAEMAKLIVVALGLDEYATGTSKFPDMSGATWAQGFVNYASGLGIVKGYPDGTFRPSATVSYDEATAMIVRALGYTDASLLPATWPANYVVKAKSLGILDDVKTSALGATRGNIAEMLYNALTVNMVSVDSENKITTLDPADNMLIRLGAEKVDAAVIYGTEDTLINLVPYTGTWAEKYLIDDEVVAVKVLSDSVTGKYNADFGTTGAGTFEGADDVDYSVNATVAAKNITYFWNGVEEPTSSRHPKYSIDTITTATNDVTVAVDLSGKRITDAYAASYWKVSKHGQFTTTDAKNIKDNQKLFTVDFILDDNNDIDTNQFVLEGVKSLDEIKVDNVVYVYDGWGNAGVKKVAVGTETVTGEVTKISGSDYYVGGKAYEFANVAVGDAPAVGDEVKLFLDAYGDIYDVEMISSTASMYGVATLWAQDTYNDTVMKIYTADDATKRFVVDDDADYTTTTGAVTTMTGIDADNALLIGYGVNEDGQIDAINHGVFEADGVDAKVKTSKVFTTNSGKDVAIASDVVVFTITVDGDLDIATIAEVQNTAALAADAQYILNKDGDTLVALMVLDTDADKEDSDIYGVINTVAKVKDGSSTVNEVVALVDGQSVTKLTTFTSDIADTEYVGLYKMTPTADGKLKVVATQATTKVVLTDVNSDGTVLTVGTSKYTIASDANVYEAVMKSNNYALDEYVVGSLTSIDDGYTVWLYDLDSSGDTGYGLYDIVIFADADYIDLAGDVEVVNAAAANITNSALDAVDLTATTAAVVNAFATAEAIALADDATVTVTLVSATYTDAGTVGTIDAGDKVAYTVVLSKNGYDVTKSATITLE